MLTNENRVILKDMAAYIEWCIQHENSFYACLANVAHDCLGIIGKEECFLPRTSGYQEAVYG